MPLKRGIEEEAFKLSDLPSIFVNVATINDSKLTYNGTTQAIPSSLNLANAGITAPSNDKPSMLSAEGKVSDLPFELVGAFGSFDAFRDKKVAYPARIRAKIADHSLEARGNLKFNDGISHFDVDASGPGPRQAETGFETQHRRHPCLYFEFSLSIRNRMSFVLNPSVFSWGRPRVIGNGGLDFTGKRNAGAGGP